MASPNICPDDCKEFEREHISRFLEFINGQSRIASSAVHSQACDFYIELMRTEQKLKTEFPCEYQDLKSKDVTSSIDYLNEDHLLFVIKSGKSEDVELADPCLKQYQSLIDCQTLYNKLKPKTEETDDMDTEDIVPECAEDIEIINRRTQQKNDLPPDMKAKLHEEGSSPKVSLTRPKGSPTGPQGSPNQRKGSPSHSKISMAMAAVEGKGKESRGAMTELRRPGDPDKNINWKESYEDLYRSWEYQQSQIDELTSRLSSFASKQLTDGNPNFTDLSDKNRPTKIGERFALVYDDEWSEAFEDIRETIQDENTIIDSLVNIIRVANTFCEDQAARQLENLKQQMMIPAVQPLLAPGSTFKINLPGNVQRIVEAATNKHAKEYRKLTALASAQDISQKFLKDTSIQKAIETFKSSSAVKNYTEKSIEQLWLMAVQDPPMYIDFAEKGTTIDKELYRFYEKKGKIVQKTVWPVVYLHKGGPVISKGYVLPK